PNREPADELKARSETARAGGSAKYAEKLRQEHKLPVRQRLELLLDPDFQIEDGLLAHSDEPGYGADGVVTVIGAIDGRTVCVMANDPTVKAGSWGPRTVEKIVRIQETAERLRLPIFYLVDSAGARITDQVQMFPGRRHAGRIFYQEVRLSGVVPQICLLFGPSAAARPPVPLDTLVPEDEGQAFNMQQLIDGVIDAGSFFEIKPLFAKEIICGLARIDGRVVGVVANQPMHKGGILFVDSADKA